MVIKIILIVCLWLTIITETATLPNPTEVPEQTRGWYNFSSFFKLPEFKLPEFKLPAFKLPEFKLPSFNSILDLPRQATNFLGKLVPKPIKDLLNYDPVPDWIPNPKEFNENDDDGYQADESARRIDTDAEVEEKIHSTIEKGNLHGLGREVIRSLTGQFSNITTRITTGLDTDRSFFSGVINGFKDQVKAIFPGTQWCGDGNIARNKKDLGFFRKTDNCCREHDNCPNYIGKDEMKHGLVNSGLFTRSHCECDQKFYDCLKESNDMISRQIGMAYFSVLGPQCFKEEYPILDCRIRVGLTNRCIEYEYDNTTVKIYQWFDNAEF